MDDLLVRSSGERDARAIERLHREAFTQEDLVPLVQDLLGMGQGVVSLAGVLHGSLIAHVMFTTCSLAGCDAKVALMGPVAVLPARQRQGVATALIGNGLGQLERQGYTAVYVLGAPKYYARFGFETETSVLPPFPLVPDWQAAWQSRALGAAEAATLETSNPVSIIVPEPWMRPRLWSP